MDDQEKCKPCPFCGCVDVEIDLSNGWACTFYFVGCPDCGTRGPRIKQGYGESYGRNKAIIRWNDRLVRVPVDLTHTTNLL